MILDRWTRHDGEEGHHSELDHEELPSVRITPETV